MFQLDIVQGNPTANRLRIEAALTSMPRADLVVLPEVFLSGMCSPSRRGIVDAGGEEMQWLKGLARDRRCAFCGSIAMMDGAACRNRMVFVTPDGQMQCYDKHHLFTYGGESEVYAPGNQRVVVEYGGMRFLLQVCYDLRFPVWSRCTDAGDYDVVLYVANWPVARHSSWDVLLRARACENLCYVIGVNRIGSDTRCTYDGGSQVVGPDGELLAACGNDAESWVMVDIDRSVTDAYRQKYGFLGDGDPFRLTPAWERESVME